MQKVQKSNIRKMADQAGISIGANEGSPYPIAAQLETFAMLVLTDKCKRLLVAMDGLDRGCTEPGFRGFQNGYGEESAGDELQAAREELAILVGHIASAEVKAPA